MSLRSLALAFGFALLALPALAETYNLGLGTHQLFTDTECDRSTYTGGYGSSKRCMQIYGIHRSDLSAPQNSALVELYFVSEAGGLNTGGSKTTHYTLRLVHEKNSPGQSYGGLMVESRNSGTGDSIGAWVRNYALGAIIDGGDEGAIGARVHTTNFAFAVTGNATFDGGSVETISPTGLSNSEISWIGHGMLIVWTQQATAITLTNHNRGTRTWTYSDTDQDFSGQCLWIPDWTYKDRGLSDDVIVPLYIDSDGTQTFTTQHQGLDGTTTSAPADYVEGAQTTSANVAPCNRIAEVNRDPNGDHDASDIQLTIAGADWSTDFTTNPTEGSCSTNCDFIIAPNIPDQIMGAFVPVEDRTGSHRVYGVAPGCIRSDPNGNSRQCDAAVRPVSTPGNVAWDHGIDCNGNNNVAICEALGRFQTSEDQDGSAEHAIEVDIDQSVASGAFGLVDLIRVLENGSLVGALQADSSGSDSRVGWTGNQLTLGADGQPFCMEVRDSDDGGWSNLTVLDGSPNWGAGQCP